MPSSYFQSIVNCSTNLDATVKVKLIVSKKLKNRITVKFCTPSPTSKIKKKAETVASKNQNFLLFFIFTVSLES